MGEPDPVTGRFPRYVYPKWFRDAIQAHGKPADPAEKGVDITTLWVHVLQTWDTSLSCDLHEFYGIDLFEQAVLERPWWWLRNRILGLLDNQNARLSRWAVEAIT